MGYSQIDDASSIAWRVCAEHKKFHEIEAAKRPKSHGSRGCEVLPAREGRRTTGLVGVFNFIFKKLKKKSKISKKFQKNFKKIQKISKNLKKSRANPGPNKSKNSKISKKNSKISKNFQKFPKKISKNSKKNSKNSKNSRAPC